MRSKEGEILIVDDNRSVLSAISILLSGANYNVTSINDPKRIPELMRGTNFDAILLDMNFRAGINSGNEGLYWLREILGRDRDASVIMITAYGDVELAVKAIQQGAIDFILKPWDNSKLIATLQAAVKIRKSRKEIVSLKKDKRDLKKGFAGSSAENIIGNSEAIRNMMRIIEKVADTDASILITGENGCGKEVVANTIHSMSSRKSEVIVPVDMGSIVDSLFESELFGHRKGAFTDASEDRMGKIELANEGTLFLDEIGNLPLPLQSKLLTVLQNRTVIPVGGNNQTTVDVRLICATNRDLEMMVREGSFREDLLYRINTITIRVPSLRERVTDIPLLADYFLKKYTRKYMRSAERMSHQAMEELCRYRWPGNVRELQHKIEKAVILCDKSTIESEDLMLKNSSAAIIEMEELSLDEMEKRLIASTIAKSGGNMSAVARQLGVTRQTLYNKIKKHGL
ncbi:MAG: sigma-54-dependent Fis family transcriptional regulator [Bacteroidales bacterium]|nr:sigma-54-dependent Fis family transcriptional regulator [Bacteroidales bacterium]